MAQNNYYVLKDNKKIVKSDSNDRDFDGLVNCDLIRKLANKTYETLNNMNDSEQNFFIFPPLDKSIDIDKDNMIFEQGSDKDGDFLKSCNAIGMISYKKNTVVINSRFFKNDDQNKNNNNMYEKKSLDLEMDDTQASDYDKEPSDDTDFNDYKISASSIVKTKAEIYKNGENTQFILDNFTRYMLSIVLNYNIVESCFSDEQKDKFLDAKEFLKLIFFKFFNDALSKGLYKEYVNKKYNDLNIKGPIDITRHIKHNTPFLGKISYNTREYSFNNRMTQLIRHVIEYVNNANFGFLVDDQKTNDNIKKIEDITPDYKLANRKEVLIDNILNPIKHAYYKEYAQLQIIAIRILKEDMIGFDENNDELNGFIIDVSWLWEEYIAKITGWKHYGLKDELATLKMFKENHYAHRYSNSNRYPDFTFEKDGKKIPVDTKYKINLDPRDDFNQMTTYIHLLSNNGNVVDGYFLQPQNKKNGNVKIGILNGLGGSLNHYYFHIPQVQDYDEFKKEIEKSEKTLLGDFNNPKQGVKVHDGNFR
jgi:5-methylcytosine-specific restriction endonuclease McrBC regulatory subunit McrC